MATIPIIQPPNPGTTPNRQGPGVRTTLDQITPPQVKGRSWLGVDPRQKMSTSLAKQGIEGYLGGPLSNEHIQQAVKISGYDDPTFQKEWTGEQYNKILAEAARLTGNTFTPPSTIELEGVPTPPGMGPGGSSPVPGLELPKYEGRGDFAFDPSQITNDPSYKMRLAEGQRAFEHAASAKGMNRGGNFMRDLVAFGQGMASDEMDRAYGRQRDIYDTNVGNDRYAHEAESTRRQVEYAPHLVGWNRDRDERQRNRELDFDRSWQKEIYGRDDAWRRHTYANDDAWRRYQLEEERRWRLANGGNT